MWVLDEFDTHVQSTHKIYLFNDAVPHSKPSLHLLAFNMWHFVHVRDSGKNKEIVPYAVHYCLEMSSAVIGSCSVKPYSWLVVCHVVSIWFMVL